MLYLQLYLKSKFSKSLKNLKKWRLKLLFNLIRNFIFRLSNMLIIYYTVCILKFKKMKTFIYIIVWFLIDLSHVLTNKTAPNEFLRLTQRLLFCHICKLWLTLINLWLASSRNHTSDRGTHRSSRILLLYASRDHRKNKFYTKKASFTKISLILQ